MKKLIKELPNLNRTIRLIGDLDIDANGVNFPAVIINDLLDFKDDIVDFYTFIKELEEDMSETHKEKVVKETIDNLLNEYSPSLEVIINSNGGSVVDGFAIIDLIRELQDIYGVEVNTHAIGMCASMAVAVYMAGDVRTAGDNAVFMMHQITGGARGSENKIQSALNQFQMLTQKYKNMFDDALIPKETLDDIMSHDVDHYFDIEKAREWGIVNDDILIAKAEEALKEALEQAEAMSADDQEEDSDC